MQVTIVLFSRCFYDATDRCQFPEKIQDCLQAGYNGKFYEDFYRVVVQVSRKWQIEVERKKKESLFRKLYDRKVVDSNLNEK